MDKVINDISPVIMKDKFVVKKTCKYNTMEIFVTNNIRTEHYSKESIFPRSDNMEYNPS